MSTPRVTSHVESFVATGSPAPDRVNFSSDWSRDEEEVPKASASSKDGDNRAPSIGAFARDEQAEQDSIGGMLPPNPSTSVPGIGTGFNVYDYQQKYPDGPHGEVAGPDAQVWKIYMDESDSYLKERMEIWKNTIDMHLIFAGIFSVVLTVFVLQASGKMRPDYTQISAFLLQELIIQLADTSGGQLSPGPPIVQSRPSHSQSDAWVNGLWFTSLSLCLMSTVLAMLIKQWLHHFTSFVSGTLQVRVRVRHYRLTGIEKWHVPALIDSLPVIMSIAVLLFHVGLIVFLAHLNIPVAVATAAVSMVAFAIYFASIILPFKYTHCPYKSQMTTCVHYLYVKGVDPLLQRCHFLDPLKLDKAALSLESRELAEVDFVHDIEALVWLIDFQTPRNPTVKDIIMQSVFGVLSDHCPSAFRTAWRIFLDDIKMAVLSCLKDDTVIPSMESKLERLLRTFRPVEEKASLSMLSLQNIDFSGVTNPQLRVLFEVFHAIEPTNSRDPHRRLNLILDYLSGPKRNVHQHPSIWEQLLNINLPNIPDQLHFAVVTEILNQLNATSIFADDGLNSRGRVKYITPSLPSSAPMPDIIHDIPEQGFLYLTRIFLEREMDSLAEISVTDCGVLLNSIMKWALMAPTCPGFKLMIREIMASLKQFSSTVPTRLVVPVLLQTSHFMDIEIVEWHTRETMIELLRAAAPLVTHEYSASFYTNLLRLIMVDNNPQAHSISKHMPSIFRFLVPRLGGYSRQNLFDAIQKEDGLSLLGRTETSRDLLEFFDNYVTYVVRGFVSKEFWMDYVHRPQSLFLICRYTIIAGRDDLLLSFAQINSAASGWRQCIQELIRLIKDPESFNLLVELRFKYQPSEPNRKVLDVVSDLKAILKLSSPEYDIPVDITEPEQNTQRSSSQIRRNSIDKPDHSGIPMDDFQPPSRRRWHFGETLQALLSSRQRTEGHERWAASHP